jgi:solute carrier family 39 (zinc transporter), member 7
VAPSATPVAALVSIISREPCLNSSCRLGIFLGFAAFFFMEKTLRVLGGGEDEHGGSHSHSHSHSHAGAAEASPSNAAIATGAASRNGEPNGLKKRKESEQKQGRLAESSAASTAPAGPSKLSAYLNLFGDLVHNM